MKPPPPVTSTNLDMFLYYLTSIKSKREIQINYFIFQSNYGNISNKHINLLAINPVFITTALNFKKMELANLKF